MMDPVPGSLIVGGAALLFAVAACHKLKSLAHFTEIFVAYRIVPEAPARRLAWMIPCAELAIALTLPWPRTRPWALMAAIILLIAYASGLAANLARNRRDLDCGCAAAGNRRPIAAWMVWRNVVLALALGTAALPWISRPLGGIDVLTIAGGLAAMLLLYAAIDRLFGDIAPRTRMSRGTAS